MKKIIPISCTIALLLLALFSCNQFPDENNSAVDIRVSTDSISFDTIISQYGTTTQSFRIINPTFQSLVIKNITLGSGQNTFFRLNIDGNPVQSMSNVELMAHDSIFVFVEATFPEMDVDSICFQLDSVVITAADQTQVVRLWTWSQDVIRKSGRTKAGEVWDGKRPYLIRDSIEIPFGEKLIIKEGTQVFFHQNAYLKIVGDLVVEGTAEQPVVFQGDRFDKTIFGDDYETAPGQWAGLVLYPFSKGSKIDHAIIKNGTFGIWAGAIGYPELAEIEISNTVIKNQSYAGLVSFGAKVNCSNTFFADSYTCILLYNQGEYNFNHVTINNNYSHAVREAGSVHVSDYFDYKGIRYNGEFGGITFNNSIIYGNIDDEFTMNVLNAKSIPVRFQSTLLKLKNEVELTEYVRKSNLILNVNPLLVNGETENFMFPDTLSPAIDQADVHVAQLFPLDIFGNSRTNDGQPDMGAVEFQK
ncbi:MAG: choice-of-anchor Q domain-containing protein [Prolixibacteraceae bacterium]